jgi:lipopolysaccharide-induced tumor necrosis factor-alpha factor
LPQQQGRLHDDREEREQQPPEEEPAERSYSPLWVIGTSFTVLSLIGTALSLWFPYKLLTIVSFIVTIIGMVGTALSFVRWKSLTSWNPLKGTPSRRVRRDEKPPPARHAQYDEEPPPSRRRHDEPPPPRRRRYEDDYHDRPRRRRGRDYEDDDRPSRRGFRCPFCRSDAAPLFRSGISAAGWVVFVVMLLFCFPLFFIGLLMQEEYPVCRDCGARLARGTSSGHVALLITLFLCAAVVFMCLISGMLGTLTDAPRR